ncbi:Deleted in malignant brain tumors 1 protein [Holothuria leucospilota]|uniref:Deleted in malignant brain tumors 1 protein n=1 Tax=Holothuria leucospilota TaxID=206669 RepID=A0A9Q1HDH4_HOLLE|nr:Deleted in malignant brain tumors 1 protein [Holothuria leucospilota]
MIKIYLTLDLPHFWKLQQLKKHSFELIPVRQQVLMNTIQELCLSGGNASAGRVEVFYNGEWGTVCDDSWDINDARVVCLQLGFSDAIARYGNAFFGQGSGEIWMDNVECNGQESSLSDCTHNGFGNHNCGHSEDAGVACVGWLSYT